MFTFSSNCSWIAGRENASGSVSSESQTNCLSWTRCFWPAPVSLPTCLTLTSHLSSLVICFSLSSDSLSDWQISVLLEELHKSLPSHFLLEMAFLPICTVSDQTVVLSTVIDSYQLLRSWRREEVGSLWVFFKRRSSNITCFPHKYVVLTLEVKKVTLVFLWMFGKLQ